MQIARVPPKLKDDRESVLAAIKLHPQAIRFADSKWLGDKEAVIACCEQVRKTPSWSRSWANFSPL